MEKMIFGHQNPDTDSITSAIALSYLKTQLGGAAKPYRLGDVNRETEFVLKKFGVETPPLLKDVKIQMKDLDYDRIKPIATDRSIEDAFRIMQRDNIRTLPVIHKDNRLAGLVTMMDIAMSLISRDQKKINTTFHNIVEALDGIIVNYEDDIIEGEILVLAYTLDKLKEMGILNQDSIVIVGDRVDIIDYVISKGVKMVIVTGDNRLSEDTISKAKERKVNIVTTSHDTYSTTKTIFLTNYLSEIMISKGLQVFKADDYLDESLKVIKDSGHSKFPIVDDGIYYRGIIGREHIINPSRKEVVLVDHNEYRQSANGIEEAKIMEVVDHHRIGDISTTLPISYRSQPVGSTNTIVYSMYREKGIKIPEQIAGLMLSGIVSDTIMLTSPTTTDEDKEAVEALLAITGLDLKKYAMDMFKAGSSLAGKSLEDIYFSDYKEFTIEGRKVGVSQLFSLVSDEILAEKNEYIAFIDKVSTEKNQFMTMLFVTDILKEGSYFLVNSGAMEAMDKVMGHPFKQGEFMADVVSRKKQIIPMLTEGFRKLDSDL